MDELSKDVRHQDLWELLYADDLVITAASKGEMEVRLRRWQEALETKGFKVNAGKSEVMASSKTGDEQLMVEDIHGLELKQSKAFKYLGSTLSDKGGCEVELKKELREAGLSGGR